jgi:ABC-type lipoprotein export system ATPase subunit
MTIRLEHMIPLPLLEQQQSSASIWDADSVIFGQGTRTLVTAPSGKGKTSLLSVIYGIRKDYRGKVCFDDRDISEHTSREWSVIRREKLSFIFQGLELFNELTALDNILLKNNLTGYKSISEIREMAQLLGLEKFLERKAGILSFGQQQRVAIIRALCQPFRFLLADECFSHMDRANSAIAYGLISSECEKQGAGLILTSLDGPEGTDIEERMEL